MQALFREQARQEKLRRDELKASEERMLREYYLTTDRINELQDVNVLNEVYAEKQRQSQLSGEVDRREKNKEQKILEEELAAAIEKKKKESILQESLRLQLKNSPQLRELERKLLLARVAKEQAVQKAQCIAAERLRKQEEKEFAEKLVEEIKKEELAAQIREQQKKAVQKQYHNALDKQIALQSATDAEEEKEMRKERELVDKMVRKLLEEDIEQERKKIEERNYYCAQIEEHRKVKQKMEDLEAQRRIEDEMKAADFRLAQSYRTQEQQEKRKAELVAKFKKQNALLKKLEVIAHEKACQENLRVELAVQEKELEDEGRDKMLAEKKARLQTEASEIYSMQMWLRHQREKLERKEEELFTKCMMEKLYREEKLALLSEHVKKEKQQEHRRMILKMIEECRAKMLAEREQEMDDYQSQRELEAEKEKLVKKERKRILSENVGDLLGFLPKGVLQDYEDVEQLGEDFKQFYAKRPSGDDSD